MIKTDLGRVTAYADAVAQGYTGTREEFGKVLANFADSATQVGKDRKAVSEMKNDIAIMQKDVTEKKAATENAATLAKNAEKSVADNTEIVENAKTVTVEAKEHIDTVVKNLMFMLNIRSQKLTTLSKMQKMQLLKL